MTTALFGGVRRRYELVRRTGRGARKMETVGWAAAAVAGLGGGVFVVGHALDQIPTLSEKAVRAITSLRSLRAAWRGEVGAGDDAESRVLGRSEGGAAREGIRGKD
ncbi:hypothetical protein [Streptomyces lavendulae]|uniref:hypothetical protein n=1 Tax=Streptomyces lavendulae TaxID=1914 RepID=UPI0036E8A70D